MRATLRVSVIGVGLRRCLQHWRTVSAVVRAGLGVDISLLKGSITAQTHSTKYREPRYAVLPTSTQQAETSRHFVCLLDTNWIGTSTGWVQTRPLISTLLKFILNKWEENGPSICIFYTLFAVKPTFRVLDRKPRNCLCSQTLKKWLDKVEDVIRLLEGVTCVVHLSAQELPQKFPSVTSRFTRSTECFTNVIRILEEIQDIKLFPWVFFIIP